MYPISLPTPPLPSSPHSARPPPPLFSSSKYKSGVLAEPEYLEPDEDVQLIARAYDAVVAVALVSKWTDEFKGCACFTSIGGYINDIVLRDGLVTVGASSLVT